MRVAICALAMTLTSCTINSSCQNEIKGRSSSPSGLMSAVVFSRNCGATVGDNYQVSIVAADRDPTDGGNVLVLDRAPPYSPRLKPIWHGDRALTIPVPAGAREFSKNSHLNGVLVTFKKL